MPSTSEVEETLLVIYRSLGLGLFGAVGRWAGSTPLHGHTLHARILF